jgi:hypothetical protein
VQAVDTPTSPDRAEQRFPTQRIRDKLGSTSATGMRSSAASVSVEKRGQLADVAQHAPHDWQGEDNDVPDKDASAG